MYGCGPVHITLSLWLGPGLVKCVPHSKSDPSCISHGTSSPKLSQAIYLPASMGWSNLPKPQDFIRLVSGGPNWADHNPTSPCQGHLSASLMWSIHSLDLKHQNWLLHMGLFLILEGFGGLCEGLHKLQNWVLGMWGLALGLGGLEVCVLQVQFRASERGWIFLDTKQPGDSFPFSQLEHCSAALVPKGLPGGGDGRGNAYWDAREWHSNFYW